MAARYDVGGLAGYNNDTIAASYSTGRVSGGDGVKGKTSKELRWPTGYSGIYAPWDFDLDNADGDL